MGFRFDTPFRYKLIIATNLVLMIATYVLFWTISVAIMIFPLHIFLEIVISVILILHGETAHILKFAVIILTIIFVILVVIFHAVGKCCYASQGLWVTVLVFCCVFRCVYVGILFLLDKASCKAYDKGHMWKQMKADTDEAFSRPHIVTSYSNPGLIAYNASQMTRASVQGYPSAPLTTPVGIGFEPMLQNIKDNEEYGWAV